ncbi:MAG: SbcC/MukB-like Walker B domain-containing protein, partial [Eubacteriales bacterium]|nr:SbcC/MukB-like Walker B domain-containing protein [Eubacteriales bacterium]
MQTYWKMNRLGFINFWKFKKEEFFFSDGCSLVRGHNGSGKSIVIQSAVTFLLDGSMRKLDPSGTNAREMAYYLLGEDKTDATGYVFLEFTMGQKYRTIGIGMRARKNKGIDFWGFGLNDGRRLEKDISLYKDGIALTKQECKSLIGSSKNNFFTDRKKDYENEVNQMLFGLSPYRYRELISLLSEIRKPIAGADRQAGLKFIYDKLNHSLSTLQEEDFDALASSMEMMDEYNEKLQIMKDDYARIKVIEKKYQDYLDSLVYKKYLTYKKEASKANILKKQWESAVEELNEIEAKRKQAYMDLTTAEIDLNEYDILDDYSDIEKRNVRLRLLKDTLEEIREKRMEAETNQEQCEYDLEKIKEKMEETKEKLDDCSNEFTWAPDLEETILTLISLTMELESLPKAAIDLPGLTKDLIFHAEQCQILDIHEEKEKILNTLEDPSLTPNEKIKKVETILLQAFLKTNNRYVERNAYVKAQTMEGHMENGSMEVLRNSEKLEILYKEYTSLPSLAPLILLDPSTEEKRRTLKEKITELENSSLFESASSSKEYRKLHERIRNYRTLTHELEVEEARLTKTTELVSHFANLAEDYEEKELETQGEINILGRSIDESYHDVYRLKEIIIEAKSLIRNLDTYVIPERKRVVKEKEEAYENQKKLSESLSSFASIDDSILKKYKEKDSLHEEHLMIEEFMKQRNDLHRYTPHLKRSEEKEDIFYTMIFTYKGREYDIKNLLQSLGEEIDEKNNLLSQEENSIYQKVLMDCLVEKINHQIEYSKEWIQRIRENMLSLETTSGMVFGIRWIQTKHIEDFAQYFKECMETYREETEDLNYMECIMECLDYRNWFEFKLEMNGKALSNKRFLTLSGGERATAIYSTLLSALTSMFNECSCEDHPRLFALDEAFTVVDGENIESVFAFIGSVGLDYLINSQTLWGTYPTVKSLSISNLTNLKGNESVIVH